MNNNYLLLGVLMGIMFGVPVGAIGALTIDRTLKQGVAAGILTGLGSSVADGFYASVVAFGMTFISDFLIAYQMMIGIIGGIIIFLIGFDTFKKMPGVAGDVQVENGSRMFLKSLAIGMTNPAAILTFIIACGYFNVESNLILQEALLLVIGVFCGTLLWWIALALVTQNLKSRLKIERLENRNRFFGIVLMIFGMIVIIRSI